MKKLNFIFVILVLFLNLPLAGQSQLQTANLGNFVLESGKVIENCHLGYRTYGTLNRDRSNAVLFPAWLGGTSEQLNDFIGKDKIVDDSQWFVIAIDPIGNGISTSPSNYSGHAESDFPYYTIGDMVKIEHKLLTEVLKIKSLYGVIGMSMGGHEVFEWIVSYPSFVKKAVSIVGTPRMTGYEQLYWQTELDILEAFQNCASCSSGRFLNLWISLFGYSAEYQNENIQPGSFDQFLDQIGETKFNINDYSSQIRAIKTHDVISKNGGSVKQAASLVKSDLMVIVATKDLICNPKTAIEFANMVGGQIHELSSPCGHISFVCEAELISDFVRKFFNN
jgi:homoserine O-acetyltransferase